MTEHATRHPLGVSRGWIDLQMYAMISVALLSGLLLWWTNASWRESLVTSQSVFRSLRQARTDLVRGHLAVMRRLAGEPDIRLTDVRTLFEQAGDRVLDFASSLARNAGHAPWGEDVSELRATLAAYGRGIVRFRELAAQALARPDDGLARHGLELYAAFAALEKQAEALETDIQRRMEVAIGRQERLGRIFFWSWLSFLVLLGTSLSIAAVKRRRAETAMIESEGKYRLLFDQVMDAIVLVAEDTGEIIDCNQAVTSEWGYRPEDLVGRPASALRAQSPPQPAVPATEIRYANGRRATLRETRLRASSGEVRDAAVKTGFFSLQGRPMRLDILRDVTARKQNETALAEREAMLRHLGDNLPQGMLYKLAVWPDGARRFLYVSRGVERIFGLEAGAVLADPERIRATYRPEDRQALIRAEQVAMASLKPFDVQAALVGEGLDGRWVQVRAAPRPGEAGELLFDGVVFEITGQKRIEDSLRQAKVEAEAASQAKSEFLANISHEVRTPLNGVLAMLQLLKSSPLDPAGAAKVATALTSAQGLVKVLTDILDSSLLEAGRLVLRRERLDPRALAADTLRMLSVESGRKAIETRLDVSLAVPPWIVTDGARLRQVLFNVVGNAIKFTERGLVALALEVASRRGREVHLLFTVRDTGIGIPEENIDAVFEPFTQIDGSLTRKYGGTGLGLGIVRRLVHLLDGHIVVESRPGRGTEFQFTIRAQVAESPPAPEAPARRPTHSRQGVKVLVVEDEAVNRLATVAMLRKLGFAAEAVEDGDQVVETLARGGFAVVLMDIQMPRVNGVEATRRIRAHDGRDFDPAIPVVALTAHALPEDRQRYLDSGMDAYLPKPVDMAALGETIDQVAGLAGAAT